MVEPKQEILFTVEYHAPLSPRMPPRTRYVIPAVLAAAAVFAYAYGIFSTTPSVGLFHDDGVYVVTAKALAEGQGYRIISIPGAPPQTKYPILFPWLLSLVWRAFPAFPANLPMLRAVPVGACGLWLCASWALLRRLGASANAASVALLLTIAAPLVLFLSTALLSETLFAALFTTALLVLTELERGGKDDRVLGLCAGLLVGASLLTRTAGAPAGVAAGLAFMLQRRWMTGFLFATGLMLFAAPWWLWVSRYGSEPILDPFYSAASYQSWNLVFNYAWPEKLAVLGFNVVFASEFGQFWGLNPAHWLGILVALVTSGCLVRGLWRNRRSIVVLMIVVYLATVLLWVFPPQRFLVPVLPVLIWFGYVGANQRWPAAAALATLLLVSTTPQVLALARGARATGTTWYSAAQLLDWRALERQYDWIKAETMPDAVLTGVHDPTHFLFTGRLSLRPYSFDPLLLYYKAGRKGENPLGTAEDFRRRLQKLNAGYVIATPRDGVAELVTELEHASPGALRLVQGDPSTGYAIYRVENERLALSAQ